MVTCNRVNSENQPVSYAEAVSSSIVSVFHPSSRRQDQYHGTAACFVPNLSTESLTADPLLVIFVSSPTGRADRVFCIDLAALVSPTEQGAPHTIKNLSELCQESEAPPSWVKWSTSLHMSQVHLGVPPPTAAPGALVLSLPSAICVLSALGELFYLDPHSGEVMRTVVVSEEAIYSAGFEMNSSAGPVLDILTGSQARLARIAL
jgi:hypothetical protein